MKPDLSATLRFDPVEGLIRLEDELATLKAEAATRGYPFDRHALRNELQAATFLLAHASEVRVLIAPSGRSAILTAPA